MADVTIANTGADLAPLAYADLVELERPGTPTSGHGALLSIAELLSRDGGNVASAGTVTLGTGSFFHITGTTTITDIDFTDAWDGRMARLIFDGKLLLTNGANLILPGGANITTGAGDSCTVIQDAGDQVRVVQFERASGLQLSNPFTCSIANQSPGASATTLLTDSVVAIPDSGVQIRSRFLYHVVMSKTGAGTVAPVILFKIGTNGTTADGTVLTFTFPSVGTAVADVLDAWIECIVVTTGATATARGTLTMTRQLGATATGWLNAIATLNRITGTAAAFNATVAALKASLALTLGASYVVTVEQVSVETYNL